MDWQFFGGTFYLRCAAGEHPKVLTDLQMELEDDIEDGIIGRLSEAEKKRLIDQLVEHRELHRQGARSTNKAAAVDAVRTELNIRDVVSDHLPRRMWLPAPGPSARRHPALQCARLLGQQVLHCAHPPRC